MLVVSVRRHLGRHLTASEFQKKIFQGYSFQYLHHNVMLIPSMGSKQEHSTFTGSGGDVVSKNNVESTTDSQENKRTGSN